MNLEIKNLNIKNYNINLNIYANEKIGVYGRDKAIIKEFLELISGINNNKGTIFIDGVNVFDNKNYFSKRVFFDFKETILQP